MVQKSRSKYGILTLKKLGLKSLIGKLLKSALFKKSSKKEKENCQSYPNC
jgi:hypothetical protein